MCWPGGEGKEEKEGEGAVGREGAVAREGAWLGKSDSWGGGEGKGWKLDGSCSVM